MARFKFKKLPASLSRVNIAERTKPNPENIYEYAKAFRGVYTRSMPILKKIKDIRWGATHEESLQLHGKAQGLAVQIVFSNELLLKAILLGTKGEYPPEHDLKLLVNCLDDRYKALVFKHFIANGLKSEKWQEVIEASANVFIDARYGFEGKKYALDFMTLQLLNEVLDDIYNNYLPDWTMMDHKQQKDKEYLENEVNLIFNEEYQAELAKDYKEWQKAFND